jgi:NAD(P)-dependent dehydrogenase (short-subunit alcohol dehydrogenase family)
MRLEDKVAIVTGAGSGIGCETAVLFAEEGARVAVADVNVDGGRETVDRIARAGGQAVFVQTDVSQGPAVKALVGTAVERWGRLDIMVNNAGVNLPCLIHEPEAEAIFDRTVAVNYKGTFYGCKFAVEQMLKQNKGAIVNIGSGNSIVAEPFLSIYCGTKGAIAQFTKGIGIDYAKHNIRVNCIAPGFIDTPINYAHAERLGGVDEVYAALPEAVPMGRAGHPREVANLCLFLASDEASYITASVHVVDGGIIARA